LSISLAGTMPSQSSSTPLQTSALGEPASHTKVFASLRSAMVRSLIATPFSSVKRTDAPASPPPRASLKSSRFMPACRFTVETRSSGPEQAQVVSSTTSAPFSHAREVPSAPTRNETVRAAGEYR
jgi:hypothetical protein